MTTNDIGKYCTQCSKNVIDFTNLTDNEVVKVIENATGLLCGHFDKAQLDRLLIQSNMPSTNPSLYKIITGLLLLSASGNSVASGQQAEIQILSPQEITKSLVYADTTKKPHTQQTDSLENMVQGKVIDSITTEPIQFKLVKIKETKVESITDIEGNFKIIIPYNLITDIINFQVIIRDYKKTEFSVYRKDLPIIKDLIVKVSREPIYYIDGNIRIIKVKKKWWQRKTKSCP